MSYIEILEAPTETSWVTVDVARRRLGSDPAEDTTLAEIIEEQSALAEGIIGRSIARTKYRERVIGRGTPRLQLSRAPLESVETLSLEGTAVDSSVFEAVVDSAQILRTDGSPWALTAPLVGRSERVPAAALAEPRYLADYWAGYYLGADPPPPDSLPLPVSLRGAVLGMIALAYNEGKRDPAIKSMRKADRQVAFFEGSPVPASSMAALEHEREKLL